MSSKTFVQTFAVTVVLFACCMSASAQSQAGTPAQQTMTPEKRALISELLEVTQAKKTAITLFNSILEAEEKQAPEMVWQAISSIKELQELPAEEQEDLRKQLTEHSDRTSKRMKELFLQKIDFAQLIEDVSYTLYDKYFTESEIRDLLLFYKSPTGKKSIAVTPDLFAESMSNTITALKPKVTEIMTELMAEEVDRTKKELESKKIRKTNPRSRTKPQ